MVVPPGYIQFHHTKCRWQGISSFLVEKKEPSASPRVKGLYMYGGVGTGKTMLMDLLVASAPPHFKVMRCRYPPPPPNLRYVRETASSSVFRGRHSHLPCPLPSGVGLGLLQTATFDASHEGSVLRKRHTGQADEIWML